MQILSENLKHKWQLLQNASVPRPPLSYQMSLKIHDVALCFHVSDNKILEQLAAHYPKKWIKPTDGELIHIYWYANHSLGVEDIRWHNEPSHECITHLLGEKRMAVQRDFVAQIQDQSCTLICPYAIDDGFFNFLRWLLPMEFIRREQILLHSSCVLNKQGEAYFCFGPSGAGKSTIASLCGDRRRILGDDMNVLQIRDGQCWAQAGALGQAMMNTEEYGRWHPVKKMFWLCKGQEVKINTLSKGHQLKFLSMSVANVFWRQLQSKEVMTIFHHVQKVLSCVNMMQVEFPINSTVWEQVETILNGGFSEV